MAAAKPPSASLGAKVVEIGYDRQANFQECGSEHSRCHALQPQTTAVGVLLAAVKEDPPAAARPVVR